MSQIANANLPDPLSAKYKGTYAYYTVKDRLPVTITKAIDFLHRSHSKFVQQYTEEASKDIKDCIERLGELRYELCTDKPLRKILDEGEDTTLWNQAFDQLIERIGIDNCSWFKAPWLYVECYMYRRIREAMLLCQTGVKNHDPYEEAKLDTHTVNRQSISSLIKHLCPLNYQAEERDDAALLATRFRVILESSLWSNKNDLSLTSGNDTSAKVNNLFELLDAQRSNIVCDHISQLWTYLSTLRGGSSQPVRIDIALDNISIELASDLILCDFLLRNDCVDTIRLHGKAYSWFVSDVTRHDFDYLLQLLGGDNSLCTARFVQRLHGYMRSDRLVFVEPAHKFWTLPHGFDSMQEVAADLYAELSEHCSLLLTKGDLNYRKLMGDLNWPFDTPFAHAIRHFKPTPAICSVRTIKCDLIVNLDTCVETNQAYANIRREFADSTKWMTSGDYALVQFARL